LAQRIEDYALIGDLHTAAMIGKDGSIDWLCLPRFDSAACMAALLGDDGAGRWKIAPADGGLCASRRYRDHSMILETRWDTPDGSVRVIDLMPPRDDVADIVRIVEGVSGTVEMRMDLVLRFDYGSIVPWVRQSDGMLEAIAGPDAVWLRTPVRLVGKDMQTSATFRVSAGDRVPFVLTYAPSSGPAPRSVDPEAALEGTEAFWSDWISHAEVTGRWADDIRDSLVVLKAMTYAPTGGLVAAATTSLPEQLGGPRNWDYRYCWLRDATFTLRALINTGYREEAHAWRDWLLRAVAGDPADLQIMYAIDGTRRLTEYEVPWLAGYEGSSPVRVGNAASEQLQLDVWGEVLDSLHLSRESGLATDDHAWDLQRALLDYLESGWSKNDSGLWESRGPERPYVHSKVMAWAGMDRAVQAVERFGLDGPVDRWRRTRQEIHDQVVTRGYDADRGTFTQFYGSEGLDAALLLIPQVGFLPYDDPRVVGTVKAVDRELAQDGFTMRYDPSADGGADGLPGAEGSFVACSFWMVNALCEIGEWEEAETRYDRLLSLRNDVGLISEEYDAAAGRQLGNTPQAYSHVGLIIGAEHLAGRPGRPLSPERK